MNCHYCGHPTACRVSTTKPMESPHISWGPVRETGESMPLCEECAPRQLMTSV